MFEKIRKSWKQWIWLIVVVLCVFGWNLYSADGEYVEEFPSALEDKLTGYNNCLYNNSGYVQQCRAKFIDSFELAAQEYLDENHSWGYWGGSKMADVFEIYPEAVVCDGETLNMWVPYYYHIRGTETGYTVSVNIDWWIVKDENGVCYRYDPTGGYSTYEFEGVIDVFTGDSQGRWESWEPKYEYELWPVVSALLVDEPVVTFRYGGE